MKKLPVVLLCLMLLFYSNDLWSQSPDTTRIRNTTVYPNNAICHLQITRRSYKTLWLFNKSFTSTGFLIGDRIVLTNAHNVHSNFFSKVTSIKVSRGREDQTFPYPPIGMRRHKVVATHVRTPKAYGFAQRASRRAKNDYALIHLPESVNPGGFLKIVSADSAELRKAPLTILGYPGKAKEGFTNGDRQFQSRGIFESLMAENMFYDIWTQTGNSGSPVFADIDGAFVVVGIHAFPGKAVRITPAVLDQITRWIAELESRPYVSGIETGIQ